MGVGETASDPSAHAQTILTARAGISSQGSAAAQAGAIAPSSVAGCGMESLRAGTGKIGIFDEATRERLREHLLQFQGRYGPPPASCVSPTFMVYKAIERPIGRLDRPVMLLVPDITAGTGTEFEETLVCSGS